MTCDLRPLLLICAITVLSCAKIADPQPPYLIPPSTIGDLRLEQQENHILLDFSLPATYADGKPLQLGTVAIYRLALPRSDQPPPAASGRLEQGGQIIAKLWPDDLKKILKDNRYRYEDVVAFQDPMLLFQRSFFYAVRFYSPRKVASQLSNIVFISPIAPALAPALRPPEVTEQAVILRWAAPQRNLDGSVPPRVIGYRVFRGSTQTTLEKISDIEGDVRQYRDAAAVPDQTYFYAVQTRSAQAPPAFGPMSATVSVTTTDVFPPSTPKGLGAVVSGGRIELAWEPNSEMDLQGYNVYRGASESAFQKITGMLVVVNSFPDVPPAKGTYYYRVTAVDLKGNESAPSETMRVDFQ
ncbi:MAG TPA: hypothetical protein VGQ81_05615 [Acidobacteriota bacterium]|nr:hypothetical protein [Acidobacteriota bacterium]